MFRFFFHAVMIGLLAFIVFGGSGCAVVRPAAMALKDGVKVGKDQALMIKGKQVVYTSKF